MLHPYNRIIALYLLLPSYTMPTGNMGSLTWSPAELNFKHE